VPSITVRFVSFPAKITPLFVEISAQDDGLRGSVPEQEAGAWRHKNSEEGREERGERCVGGKQRR
jgi:hypothetical protein